MNKVSSRFQHYFPFMLPLGTREGPGPGHAQNTAARPPWARPPPLGPRLPKPSRRQPRASRAQSGGIARDERRERGAGGPGRACAAPLQPMHLRALCAPPRPRRPIHGLLTSYLHMPRLGLRGLARGPACKSVLSGLAKCLLREGGWTGFSSSIPPFTETLEDKPPPL